MAWDFGVVVCNDPGPFQYCFCIAQDVLSHYKQWPGSLFQCYNNDPGQYSYLVGMTQDTLPNGKEWPGTLW